MKAHPSPRSWGLGTPSGALPKAHFAVAWGCSATVAREGDEAPPPNSEHAHGLMILCVLMDYVFIFPTPVQPIQWTALSLPTT